MTPRRQVSKAGIALIKRFEGLELRARPTPGGGWTIGYGHTQHAREGLVVDEAGAESLLLYDLIGVTDAVDSLVFAPTTQHQFDALTSFAFSIGIENFRRSATLRLFNEGRLVEAALAMELWRMADIEGETVVVDALVRRRAVEKTHFLEPSRGWPAAPRALLPPLPDKGGADAVPSSPVLTVDLTPKPATPAEDEGAPVEPAAPMADETVPPSLATPLAPPRRSGSGPLWLLGILGVGLFVFAICFGFRSPAPGVPVFGGGFFGWLFGLAGVALVALAAFLLTRRAGRDLPPSA